MKSFTKDQIQEAISNTKTMGGAAKYLKLDRRTFHRCADKYGLYVPLIIHDLTVRPLDEILQGLHPEYSTNHLSRRLLQTGRKKRQCEECGITEWNGKPISFELNHKDGDNSNHKYINLEFLCPNCHSQTDTYKSKKRITDG